MVLLVVRINVEPHIVVAGDFVKSVHDTLQSGYRRERLSNGSVVKEQHSIDYCYIFVNSIYSIIVGIFSIFL